jgi:hypothetical protein
LAERLIYVEEKEQAKLAINTDKVSYASKSKVTVSIKATDKQDQPVKANLSFAAVDAGLIPVNEENIISYLNLTSEIKGVIHNPGQYFDLKNPDRMRRLDLLLLTQGWRDFVWKRIADSARIISYPAEQGITVSGRTENRGKPVAQATITLSADGPGNLRSAISDSTGRFYVDDLKLSGRSAISISAKDNHLKSVGVSLMDSVPSLPVTIVKQPIGVEYTFKGAPLFEQWAREKARKSFLSDTLRLKEVAIKGQKITVVNLDTGPESFVDFGYKDELFNITPADRDKNNVTHYLAAHSTAVPSGDGVVFDGVIISPTIHLAIKMRPRMFVNGRLIPTILEQARYYNLQLNKVKKIVLKHLVNIHGSDAYFIYLTIDPEVDHPVDPGVLKTYVQGYDKPRVFFTPVYEKPTATSDLRTTIHWDSDITTNEKGEATISFYNADQKTRIRIVAEGITWNGTPVSATATYDLGNN